MRINIYSEELTDEITVVTKTDDKGDTFYGVRIMLLSSNALHHSDADDDRSAVTIWLSEEDQANHLRDAIWETL